MAVAWAALGLPQRAGATLTQLARRCGPDGWFAARTDPMTGAAPDDRERQLDGTAWFLWAADEIAQRGGAGQVSGADTGTGAETELLGDALRRCTELLLRVTEPGGASARGVMRGGRPARGSAAALPPPSPDYRERPERQPTIATCALVAAGLERAARHCPAGLAEASAQRAAALRERIARDFGPTGYGRYPGRDLPDAGIAFLLPPYAPPVTSDSAAAPAGAIGASPADVLPEVVRALARPAGGLAPGAGWHRDGISWTPATALMARALRESGHGQESARLRGWLTAHRTAAGSLPEKVRHDGTPTEIAPLGWTAALVVLDLLS
ncbi:hypothetical protein JSY14_06585 [Brachybacterium sp. EF45031]|uniref:hypothetical protein n=1 Tax=Brachybacterium sillae TaxID=2810536 RepID=UPI00217D7E79|nr:hypothetical protein [Brachybacterium sillae]MCS6711701.1 hypothetical protein [Brachybacterium sillae]